MIDQFVAKTFASRNLAHLAHFKTKSYAEHKALNDFYEAVIPAVDAVVEAYQGCFPLIDVTLMAPLAPSSIVKHLESDVTWIAKNRSKIAKDIPAIENLVDAVTEVYLSTLYKLKNLS